MTSNSENTNSQFPFSGRLTAIDAMREAGVFARLAEAAGTPRFVRPMPDEVDEILAADAAITHVVLVHCETSSGIQ